MAAKYPLANVCPCKVIVGPYVMMLSNSGESMLYPCEKNKCCVAAVIDLPDGTRKEIKCGYTSGMNPYKYRDTLSRTLFETFFALGLVRTPSDPLVVDLLNFVIDSTIISGHVCPKDGPVLLTVAYIRVAPLFQPPPLVLVPQSRPSYFFGVPPQPYPPLVPYGPRFDGSYFGVPQQLPQRPYFGMPQQHQQFVTSMSMSSGRLP